MIVAVTLCTENKEEGVSFFNVSMARPSVEPRVTGIYSSLIERPKIKRHDHKKNWICSLPDICGSILF